MYACAYVMKRSIFRALIQILSSREGLGRLHSKFVHALDSLGSRVDSFGHRDDSNRDDSFRNREHWSVKRAEKSYLVDISTI